MDLTTQIVPIFYELSTRVHSNDLGKVATVINMHSRGYDEYIPEAPPECYTRRHNYTTNLSFIEDLYRLGIYSWYQFEIVMEAIKRRTSLRWIHYHFAADNPFPEPPEHFVDVFRNLLRITREENM